MKTLSEHNHDLQDVRARRERIKHLAGVLCDQCRVELHLTQPGLVNLSHPPTVNVRCPECLRVGSKLVG